MVNSTNIAEFKIGRRKKMTFRDFDTIGVYFDDFYRVKKQGYVYRMESILTQEQKEFILSFKNTKIALANPRYAPEIKYSLVFIGDKCFKKGDK